MQNDEKRRSIKQKPQAHKRSRLCFLQGEYVHRPQLFIRQFLRQLFKLRNQYFPFVLHSFFSVPTYGKGLPLFSVLTFGSGYPLFSVPT